MEVLAVLLVFRRCWGYFFCDAARVDDQAWLITNDAFHAALVAELHEPGMLVEPGSRDSWFLCEAHDVKCHNETLDNLEQAAKITLQKILAERQAITTA